MLVEKLFDSRADMIAAGWSPSVRLFEAAACGCPVVATTESPLPELLGDAALYVQPRRPDELHQALQLHAVRRPTAILIDAESGSVLFEKDADRLVPPAFGSGGGRSACVSSCRSRNCSACAPRSGAKPATR